MRFCNQLSLRVLLQLYSSVATEITACGFVTVIHNDYLLLILVATEITACGFVTILFPFIALPVSVATEITACGFVTYLNPLKYINA